MKLSKKTLIVILISIAAILTIAGFITYYFYFMNINNAGYKNIDERKSYIIKEAEGNDLSMYKGKKIVIIVFASWCPNCAEEMPSIVATEKEFKDVQFLYVSHDKNVEDLENFIINNNYNIYAIHDPNKFIRTSLDPEANTIPRIYLLDEKGFLIGANKGTFTAEELKEFINTNGASGNGQLVPKDQVNK